MRKNACFYHSFINAFRGIFRTLRTERNFRVHIAAALAVITLAYFYGLDRAGWAVLALAMATVIAAELFNTAIEHACDAQTDEYNEKIRFSKDAAAGGVLLAAIGAVAVGVCLFGDFNRLAQTLRRILESPVSTAVVCAVIIFDLLLLAFGGKNS